MSNQITTVVVDGPFPNANKWSDWEEYPEWTVSITDDEGNDIGRVYSKLLFHNHLCFC